MADEAQARSAQRNWVAYNTQPQSIDVISVLWEPTFRYFYDVVGGDPKEAMLADEAKSEVGVARLG